MKLEKIRQKITESNIIEKLLIIFIIIQPLLDIYILFQDRVVNYFGASPATFVRIFFLGFMGVLFLLVLKSKREKIWYIVYGVLIVVYAVLHHINAIKFTDFYGGYDFGYSLKGEIFYIIRMLLPFAMIIISSHYKFEDKKINRALNILLILLCGSIIATNLFKVSLGSYSKETIGGNIFCWFQKSKCNLSYYSLASKGFFNDPNRIAALLVLLSSIMFYMCIKNDTIYNKIMIMITLFGMYILGTKVSTLGFFIISILSLFIYLFFSLIKKEIKYKHSNSIFLVVVIVIGGVMLPFSPAINRTQTEQKVIDNYNSNKDDKLSNNDNSLKELNDKLKDKYKDKIKDTGIEIDEDEEKTPEEMLEFLDKYDKEEKSNTLIIFIELNYLNYNINPQFIIDSYPYKLDPDFWYKVMNMSLEDRTNFRLVEEMMLKRVKEINNRKMDDWFGITFTREGNIFDLERDFISHYYTLGIIGLILLLVPYLIIVIVCSIKILTDIKNKLNLKNTFYLMGIGIALFAAFYSGNVMDGLIVTLILGFVIGQLINSVFDIKI